MKNIGIHIAQILRRQVAIELPGIGILTREYSSVRYDADLAVFFPPVLRLRFVANEKTENTNDFEPFSEAWETARQTLEVNGTLHLEGIGTLYQQQGRYSFTPLQQNFLPYKPIPERHDILPIETEAVLHHEVTEAIHPEAAEVIPEETFESTSKNNRWVAWLSVALLLAIGGGGYYYYQNQSQPEAISPFVQADEADTLSTNKETTFTASTGDSSSALPSTDTVTLARVDTTVATKPELPVGNFEIIIASFHKLEKAERYVATMNAKGYSLRVLHPNRQGNRFKVSYGAYTTPQEADKILQQVRNELVSGAWIYERPVKKP